MFTYWGFPVRNWILRSPVRPAGIKRSRLVPRSSLRVRRVAPPLDSAVAVFLFDGDGRVRLAQRKGTDDVVK